jgi:acyl carrier protein
MLREIHDYLVTELAAERDSFAADENLLAQGIIDSMGILKLVTFLEDRFGIEAGDDDLVPEHFETLQAICAFVESKRNG